ncbi:hypothetical protein [Halorubellus sp. PRR65]|uniref:hypothetical protein n=1 Tax=Halorubellus sp. PRR65 TaxID=3098148 RepID=UPI002B25B435|nr:hypothetical protein [Halorubellus sp. PRR65]
MPARRRALALLAGALTATSGCVTDDGDSDPPLEHGERLRARGDPERVTKQVTDDDVAYVASTETDQGESTTTGGFVLDGGRWPFREWAAHEAALAGRGFLKYRFESGLLDRAGIGVETPDDWTDPRLVVRHVTRPRNAWETGTIDPELDTTRLVEDLPKTLAVTVEFADRSQTTRFPVYVQRENYVDPTTTG